MRLPDEPAFPCPYDSDDEQRQFRGVDTRTWIAAKALQGILSDTSTPAAVEEWRARTKPPRSLAELRAIYAFEAVKLADALLEELAK